MIQTKPYEFMVQFTPQREWIERRGILLWLAFFFVELGSGMFIVSSILGSSMGMLIGWLICAVLGGGLHLLYLGHPIRFWRILLSSGWKSSWISRGLYFIAIFLTFGLIHMILAQWEFTVTGLLITADIFAFLTVIYGGFAMAFVNGIKLWNTPMIPLLFAVGGIWGGIGLTVATVLATGQSWELASLEPWSRLFLTGYAIILIVYLVSIRYAGEEGNVSVEQIVKGRWRTLFWVMVAGLGIVVPLIVMLLHLAGGFEVPVSLIYLLILFELLGDLSLRYCILRCGYYHPLIPSTTYSY